VIFRQTILPNGSKAEIAISDASSTIQQDGMRRRKNEA
jgi:hypothetical protein